MNSAETIEKWENLFKNTSSFPSLFPIAMKVKVSARTIGGISPVEEKELEDLKFEKKKNRTFKQI